jgi:hypothetical protein
MQNQKSKPCEFTDSGGPVCSRIVGARLWRWRYRFHGREMMTALGSIRS